MGHPVRILRRRSGTSRAPFTPLSAIALLVLALGCGSSDGTGMQSSSAAPSGYVAPPPLTTTTPAATPSTTAPTMMTPVMVATQQPAGASDVTTRAPASWCDSLGVIQDRCQTCHGQARMFGAPMSMVTYADLQAPAVTMPSKKVYELVGTRIHDTVQPMPPNGFTALSPAELSVLDAWVAAGAPAGADPTCGGTDLTPPSTLDGAAGAGGAATNDPTADTATDDDWPADCEARYKFVAYTGAADTGQKASVPPNSEQHPQFFFDIPWKAGAQALRWKPVVDNSKVLHHWILYASDGAFLDGWAPGSGGAKDLDPDVGMYLPPPGGQIRMDMHYNNLGRNTTEEDASGVEVCVVSDPAKLRAHTATVMGLTASANAPAHQSVDNSQTCTVTALNGPVHILSTSPHMHKLGTHSSLTLNQGGQTTVLHDGAFTFDEQRIYPFDPEVVVNSGDQLTTVCSYTNDSDRNVTFGQSTNDEMCFNFVLYWPKDGFVCF